MRQIFVAGNWKMNLDLDAGLALVKALNEQAGSISNVTVAVCPPAVYLKSVADALADSNIAVGAQDMHWEDSGAYTAELSGQMLLDVGCTYVILGHSERRHVFGELDEGINKKVLKALALGLKPILAVGEKLDQREAGQTEDVVGGQLRAGLAGVSAAQMAEVTIAYEPVWAIGTGETASPEQAEAVHVYLRGVLAELYGAEIAEATIIQYGGSVKPSNAAELLGQPNVDGALVGGAALKPELFVPIIEAGAAL
jgi:triosephosphate isomerase (TIM)